MLGVTLTFSKCRKKELIRNIKGRNQKLIGLSGGARMKWSTRLKTTLYKFTMNHTSLNFLQIQMSLSLNLMKKQVIWDLSYFWLLVKIMKTVFPGAKIVITLDLS
jgi:hypothetical protein